VLRDKKAEKQFNFDMLETLRKRKEFQDSNSKVFSEISFYVSPNLVGPLQVDMIEIIKSAGGKILDSIPDDKESQCIIVSHDKEKKSEQNKFKGRKVYGNEFIFSSIMKQEVNFEE
jgi:hypothetical protein